MLKQKLSRYFLVALLLILYLVIGYATERHQTVPLFMCYFSLFLIYIYVIRVRGGMDEAEIRFWIAASLAFRFALLFSVPSLSDDFYRFIWDGRLLASGYHPFAEVPSFYIAHPVAIPGIDAELFNHLNAKETFTVYPPFAQFIFWLSVVLSSGSVYGSVIVMKLIIFTFEVATLWLFASVLRQFRVPPARVLLYALNPLVIIELTGNLHFEGIMIFFLLLSVWLLMAQPRTPLAPAAYALSICTKLITLVFLPLFLRYLGWRKTLVFWIMTAVFTVLFFLPLLNRETAEGLSSSLGYYFQRFEFNASIYYLIREAGYALAGFNIIQYAGPFLGAVAAILILIISFRNLPAEKPGTLDERLFRQMLWCLLIYFLSTTILHPWYIITLFAISILTPYRFPLLWTGLIFLTYAGYGKNSFEENLFLVAVEYIILFAYLLYELLWTKRLNHS